ncbi:MAG: heme ABC transporter permease [Pseudomonadota bacterium]|nr:heme ABC transporter permease [Pseudomonadota bacterium]
MLPLAFITDYANPEKFERIARPLTPVLAAFAVLAGAAGLYFALFNSPADYQQGESVRIMYVHVPAAWMALFCYTAMAAASVAGFIWKHPLADTAAKATAPIGAIFTALALITGSLWGKPMWGTWWAWDARLTSVLILFFLYLGYIAVWEAVEDKIRAAKLAAIVAIVGFVNVPIIKFSVDWWNSLHQPASVFRADGPTIHASMLTPLLLMGVAYTFTYAALLLVSMRAELAARRLARLDRLQTERISGVREE